MKRASWKLLIMREGKSSQHMINFSRQKVIWLASVLFIVIGSISFMASRFVNRHLTQIALSEVRTENSELKRQLSVMNERVGEIQTNLTDLFEKDDNLRLAAGMPRIDDEVRQVGIGGTIPIDATYGNGDETVQQLIFDIAKIEREIRLQYSSFLEIDKKIRINADLIAHTPSIRPVEGGYTSSRFGMRTDPFSGKWKHHNGLDFVQERGAPVYATANGKVIFAKNSPGFGKLVIIDHGYSFSTSYGHLGRLLVKKGQTVERGQKIGEIGNTGRSTGPHLHYEVAVNKKAVDPIDYLYDDFAVRSFK